MELIGPYLVGCALLVLAGAAKMLRPDDTARALAAVVPMTLARTRRLIQVGATAEAVLGVVALAYPRTLTAGAGGPVVRRLRRLRAAGPGQGRTHRQLRMLRHPGHPRHPAPRGHQPGTGRVRRRRGRGCAIGSIVSVLSAQPFHGLPLMLVSALCVWLTFLSISVLGALQAARRLVGINFRS